MKTYLNLNLKDIKTMEDNKLIADFMGKEWHKEFFKDVFIISPSNITYKFDTDWNWLMEVVEKINNTGRFEVIIQYGFCYITDGLGELTLSLPEKNTIYAVHKAVVEFIKWYNENNK